MKLKNFKVSPFPPKLAGNPAKIMTPWERTARQISKNTKYNVRVRMNKEVSGAKVIDSDLSYFSYHRPIIKKTVIIIKVFIYLQFLTHI